MAAPPAPVGAGRRHAPAHDDTAVVARRHEVAPEVDVAVQEEDVAALGIEEVREAAPDRREAGAAVEGVGDLHRGVGLAGEVLAEAPRTVDARRNDRRVRGEVDVARDRVRAGEPDGAGVDALRREVARKRHVCGREAVRVDLRCPDTARPRLRGLRRRRAVLAREERCPGGGGKRLARNEVKERARTVGRLDRLEEHLQLGLLVEGERVEAQLREVRRLAGRGPRVLGEGEEGKRAARRLHTRRRDLGGRERLGTVL